MQTFAKKNNFSTPQYQQLKRFKKTGFHVILTVDTEGGSSVPKVETISETNQISKKIP